MAVSVYLKKISNQEPSTLFSEKRRKEIDLIKNAEAKREKIAVWSLLEWAIERAYRISPSKVNFNKCESGKWVCDLCEFSLAHSSNFVAVALSDEPVGVDIELYDEKKLIRVARRILTKDELTHLEGLREEDKGEYIIGVWTGKEATLKRDGDTALLPTKKERKDGYIHRQRLELDEKTYHLAVATNKAEEIAVNII